MSKIIVDQGACVGCGLCVNACPDCFELNDDNVAKVIAHQCSSCDLNEIAAQCPVNAIVIEA